MAFAELNAVLAVLDNLKRTRDVVKQAWEKCGLSQVLDRAQQFEARAFCMNAPAEVLGEDEEEAVVNVTDSEEEEDEEEEEGGQDD